MSDDCEEGFAHADGAYDQALEAELGYGWIDWLARRIDEDRYMQRFTPLRRRSNWSLRTPRRAEAMIEAERKQSRRGVSPRSGVRRPTGGGTEPPARSCRVYGHPCLLE